MNEGSGEGLTACDQDSTTTRCRPCSERHRWLQIDVTRNHEVFCGAQSTSTVDRHPLDVFFPAGEMIGLILSIIGRIILTAHNLIAIDELKHAFARTTTPKLARRDRLPAVDSSPSVDCGVRRGSCLLNGGTTSLCAAPSPRSNR